MLLREFKNFCEKNLNDEIRAAWQMTREKALKLKELRERGISEEATRSEFNSTFACFVRAKQELLESVRKDGVRFIPGFNVEEICSL